MSNTLPNASQKTLTNFGENFSFTPEHFYQPQSEAEVLEILRRHRQGKIRVIGSLYSWSEVARGESVVVSLEQFTDIESEEREDGMWIRVGAGCTLQTLLTWLQRHAPNWTLPTLGAVTRQTIAGAIATGTHGSGKSSLSHFVEEVRIATFDPESGEPTVFTWNSGEELLAARCSLGCLGIVLSVRIRCIPQYQITETVRIYDSVAEIIEQNNAYPLQQFALIPGRWKYVAFHREVGQRTYPFPRSYFFAFRCWCQRWVLRFWQDRLFHWQVQSKVNKSRTSDWIEPFYRKFERSVQLLWGFARSGRSDRMLTFDHQAVRHLNIEIIVPEKHLLAAAEFAETAFKLFAGVEQTVPTKMREQLSEHNLPEIDDAIGFYHLHYLVAYRRILADETLISPASGTEPAWYSLGFFTYEEPDKQSRYNQVARYLTVCLQTLYSARVHWGKYFPLGNEEIAEAYPALPQFREICSRYDPNRVFLNQFTSETLGFSEQSDRSSITQRPLFAEVDS